MNPRYDSSPNIPAPIPNKEAVKLWSVVSV
jgi:hypothetical protein